MFKKKIINIASVDLTKYSPAALRKIGKISNCATVFLPENPSNEFIEAYSEIKLFNVANVIRVPQNKQICITNGVQVLANVSADNVYVVNGTAVVLSAVSDEPVSFIVNGSVIYREGLNINFLCVNGAAEMFKCNPDKLKVFTNKIEINADFIRNCETGANILCDNKMKIAQDVSEEMLKEKELYFICMNKVYCKKEVYGYIAANSQMMNKIITDEEEYRNWDKKFI